MYDIWYTFEPAIKVNITDQGEVYAHPIQDGVVDYDHKVMIDI